ncbi:MAG: chorismate synthase [Crocinitomicaceae bacterium]|nr:chorismate synthase [Crocinitomicaceae bacterium]
MAGNSFGNIYKLTSFGESHGKAIGGVIDGCPAGIELNLDLIQHELRRRKPGQSNITTPRKEEDEVEFLSGIFEGKTTGTPIGFLIRNQDQQSGDYDALKDIYRPSHADYTYEKKYGIRDHRGGGRSSARETIARVVAGAIAKQILSQHGITFTAYVSQIGPVEIPNSSSCYSETSIESNAVRCPDETSAKKMIAYIESCLASGDSTGGKISCFIQGVPVGLGEPVFDKLHADIGKAMLSINAVKGFEIGSGFRAASMKGSEHNDAFEQGGKTKTNFSGGIQGGISNGSDIYFHVAFKPVATIQLEQDTISKDNSAIKLAAKGRHDPCVVPRAVPIVEAMAAMVILDHWLRNKATTI